MAPAPHARLQFRLRPDTIVNTRLLPKRPAAGGLTPAPKVASDAAEIDRGKQRETMGPEWV
jgi:hypothetical protein